MSSQSDCERFMRRAIELSAKGAQEGGAPFGAVVVKNGEIVGEGHNTVVRSRDPSAHGEVVAIRDACKNLKMPHLAGCELYTSCEPCAMCTSVTWLSRFNKVYYANCFQNTLKYCSMEGMFQDVELPVESRSTPAERLCADEAWQVFASCIENKIPTLPPVTPVDKETDKKRFMLRAIELSAISARAGGLAFGAVVVREGDIIGEGHNLVEQSCDPSAHGEVVAIRDACKKLDTWDLSGCELYTSCSPCAMCTAVIWLCRFDKIYYGNSLEDSNKYRGSSHDEMFGDVAKHVEKRSIPATRMSSEEARQVITEWGEMMSSRIDQRLGVAVSDVKSSTA